MNATRKLLVILNPVAGKGKAGQRQPEIERLMAERGLVFDLRLTECPGHAIEIAAAACDDGYDVIVAAGGDGTVNEVVNGMMAARLARHSASASGPALGVLSVGRGNDFCYGADLPGTLVECVDVLARDKRRPLDVGLIKGGDYPNGKHFANGIGVGFDTIVGLEAAKLRHVHGFLAYVIGALRTFVMYPEAPEIRISWEDTVVEQASHQISIMNGKRMGGTFFMAPDAENHDGRLELCMAGRMNRREMLALMARYTKGTQAGHPRIRTGGSSRFMIEAPNGGLIVHADGETICTDGHSLEVACLPGALSIVCEPGRVASQRAARHSAT
ncbi:MAG TPA: YegS/Rv2252/BmrU family lipid kinase [bacterium]|nr:YegS/Rv2252/BmrU family lipid kinase [bacterium]